MIAWSLLPGLARLDLEALAAQQEPVWVYGPPGSGRSALATEVARLRGGTVSEDKTLSPCAVAVATNPPPDARWLGVKLAALDEMPEAIAPLLHALAQEEGLAGAPPAALGRLPCPGNLRELRNRVLRFKLLGQLPEAPEAGAPVLDAEDLATNLHQLEAFLLHRALRRSYGNRVEASSRLGVSRRQLYILIQRHGDPVKGEAPSGELPKRLSKRKL
ncbi:MAG TPA: helix-turn-helix domain-containing protein [Holophagaceae bacterium]|jgi:transcriptional regulator with AAA-type ATPase domain|nr:helix-turn-helix domain-containing protein [Holophagaceae bacterium]